MIGWVMRRLRPGSTAWLTLHELRIRLAMRERKLALTILRWLVLLVYAGIGVALAIWLHDVPITVDAMAYVVVLFGCVVVFTLMLTQALLAAQSTIYETGDLDLLFSAPLDPRAVVSAKLAGIAGGVMLTFMLIALPPILPLALYGHPELLGLPALVLALALVAACLGLALTLLLARIAGPRAARTLGQILGALSGGAIFLVSQLNHDEDGRRSGIARLFDRFVEQGLGTHGLLSLPGRAAFGEPLAVALLLGTGILVFALTGWLMRTLFLRGYQAGGMRLSRTRKAKSGIAGYFHKSLFATILAKEWRLLARDPALVFHILTRLIYLAPLLLPALRHTDTVPIAASLAFFSVAVAGQLVPSLAWLAVSAEDTPDLIAIAPVEKDDVNNAKLFAALLMATPLAILLPIGIALETIPGAIVTLVMTGVAGALTGHLVVAYAKPAPRTSFQRRRNQGSFLLGLFEFIITVALGLVTGVLVYFL
jgi:ABC-2 type transport system permease protein